MECSLGPLVWCERQSVRKKRSCETSFKISEKNLAHAIFLPSAREGNVLTGVCHSVRGVITGTRSFVSDGGRVSLVQVPSGG